MSLKIFIATLKQKEILLPILRSHLIREAELEEKKKQTHQEVVVRDAEQTIACFKERKAEYNHRQKLDGEYFHPSQLGRCLRQMFFDEKHAPTDGTITGADRLRSALVFEVGTYFHVLFQNLCERAGVLSSREIAIRDDINRHLGHADGKLKIKGTEYLLEIKTINGRGFAALKEPKAEHKLQMMAYMKSLKLKAAVIIYYNKETSECREYLIQHSDIEYRKKVAPRIEAFFKSLKTNVPPPQEGSSPYKMPCSYCQYRELCFSPQATKSFLKTLKTKVSSFRPKLKIKFK